MSFSEDQIKAMVRRVLLRTLGPNGLADSSGVGQAQPDSRPARPTVTEADVLVVPPGGRLALPAEAVITPLARDTALDRRVELVREPGPLSAGVPSPAAASKQTVALGADHGGYAMKEDLKAYLGELGYTVIDCGTHSTASVDYPDFAYTVAKLVSEGKAWRGIVYGGQQGARRAGGDVLRSRDGG
jgi:hypothetical protein